MAVQSVYYLDTIHVGDGRDDVENYQSILNSVALLSLEVNKRKSPQSFSFLKSALGVTRTLDPRIRNPLLYPAELRELMIEFTINRSKPATKEKRKEGSAQTLVN